MGGYSFTLEVPVNTTTCTCIVKVSLLKMARLSKYNTKTNSSPYASQSVLKGAMK